MRMNVLWFQTKVSEYEKICEDALEASKKISRLGFRDWLDSPWKGFFQDQIGTVDLTVAQTGVDENTLNHIGNVSDVLFWIKSLC